MPRTPISPKFPFERYTNLFHSQRSHNLANAPICEQVRAYTCSSRRSKALGTPATKSGQSQPSTLAGRKEALQRNQTPAVTSNIPMARLTSTSRLATSRLSRPLPNGTIDSHCHIIPPDFNRFPTVKTAQYKPSPHTISDAMSFYNTTSGLGISNPRMVLTQVSIYGTDNSALLSGIADLANDGRGVAEFSPDTPLSQLEKLWNQGIRGARINLVSRSAKMNEAELQDLLQSYVDALSQMTMSSPEKKWVIEMYIPLGYVAMLPSILSRLRNANSVRFVVDHFAGLMFKDDAPNFRAGDDPCSVSGFKELVTLLTDPSLPEVYVKLSAAYRIDANYPSKESLERLGAFGRELINKARDRVCWASDWPHTRFEDVDSVAFVEACYEWCGEGKEGESMREKLFKTNSEKLWDMA